MKILNSLLELRTSNFLLVVFALAACATATPKPPPAPVNTGAVSARLITDPNAPEVQLAPGEEFVQPQLDRANPPPMYPPALLPLDLPPHTIAVRVTFDESGKLSQIGGSPIAASTNDRYRPVFEAAVRDAVNRWRCWPPSIRKFRQETGYRVMISERRFKTFFDVAFSFEVINGKAVVRRAQK